MEEDKKFKNLKFSLRAKSITSFAIVIAFLFFFAWIFYDFYERFQTLPDWTQDGRSTIEVEAAKEKCESDYLREHGMFKNIWYWNRYGEAFKECMESKGYKLSK